jgi:uncharacterized repeat protein (TIGR03803 family)
VFLVVSASSAQNFKVLHSFNGGDGSNPYSGLLSVGNTLYGTTQSGGSSGAGTIFAISADGTTFTTIHSFTGGNDGGGPAGSLIALRNRLYGTTTAGGSSSNGTVFSVNTDGTGFTNLYNFIGQNDGAQPYGALVLSSNILYGTAGYAGSAGYGTVFCMNIDGTGYKILHTFTASDGANPKSALVLSGTSLYGTTPSGGASGWGSVFRLNTDGTGFTNIYSFSSPDNYNLYFNSDGANPNGVILSSNTLYGTTMNGGSDGFGTVFKVNTDGSGFSVLHTFTAMGRTFTDNDGSFPMAGLTISDGVLYGAASGFEPQPIAIFGTNHTLFRVNTDGTGFMTLHDFYKGSSWPLTNTDGVFIYGSLILAGYTLYGTAFYGGSAAGGTIFSLSEFGYTTNDVASTITGYFGPGGEVTIPSSIGGLPVTCIGSNAFFGLTGIIGITIPDGVSTIGYGAFSACQDLTHVAIPNSVTSIGDNAFNDCVNLTNVAIPSSVTNIGSGAFATCLSLTGVNIPSSVLSIGQLAFFQCTSLTNITIPKSVTAIGGGAFQGCPYLTSIEVDPANPAYSTLDGLLFDKQQTVLVEYPGVGAGSYTIPNSVRSIADYAFIFCTGLTNIIVPSSVATIGVWAFSHCSSLTDLYFEGPAPVADSSIFFWDNGITVHYLPGNSGWDATFYGMPTVLWVPHLQIGPNQFGFNISWATGKTVIVEASTSLSNPVWQPQQTNTLGSGSAYFSDPEWTNYSIRFYRVRSQ